jgi:hypothetical protein
LTALIWTAALVAVAVVGRVAAQDTTSELEPDHLYVWASLGAPEGAVLRELGITQYPDTVRPGEGVEWITFAFENVYLELLWVSDEALFEERWASWHEPHTRRARWRSTQASPFGLAFHRIDPTSSNVPTIFHGEDWWDEQGGYVSSADAQTPFLMLMGPRHAMPEPVWMTSAARRAAENAVGIERLTKWSLATPEATPHEALSFLEQRGALDVTAGASEHLLTLVFDEGRQGKTFDARPALPIVIRY